MIKRVDNVEKLKVGDEIMLFVVASGDKAKTVTKKCFRVSELPYPERGSLKIKCEKIREDGSYMRDDYGDIQSITFVYSQENKDFLVTNSDNYWGYINHNYYFKPSIPCEKIIKRLVQEKRKLNKYIVDCQNLMYKKNEQEESGI